MVRKLKRTKKMKNEKRRKEKKEEKERRRKQTVRVMAGQDNVIAPPVQSTIAYK